MRHTAMMCLLGFWILTPAWSLQVQPAHTQKDGGPWWVSMDMGEGQIKLSSDLQDEKRVPTFAIGFQFGHQAGKFARAGVDVGGWTLQAFDLNDPTVGESVGNVMGVVDVFPLRRGLFARGGLGWSSYTNNQPTGANGTGFAWKTGAGYEFPLGRSFRLVPIVTYSAGSLGDANYPNVPPTGGGYSVIDFKFGVVYRFGGQRQ